MSDSNVDPPRVTGLNVHPIKSCRAVLKTEIAFDAYGVVGDRRFMIIDGNGRLLAQRQFPIMATVTASFVSEKGRRFLCASAPSMSWDLKFEPVLEGHRIDAIVWNSHLRVVDQGEIPAKWFNQLLGSKAAHSRLVASAEKSSEGESYERTIWNLPSGLKNKLPPSCLQVGLADSAPVSLVSHESLEDLNVRLKERGVEGVPLNRFRMNIEIDGCSRPYEEDEWVKIRIGEVPFLIYRESEVFSNPLERICRVLKVVEHCVHCIQPLQLTRKLTQAAVVIHADNMHHGIYTVL